jgi:NAD(P)-dependent dehydrogenase (short-subunit alcohol dehydrogenase family)
MSYRIDLNGQVALVTGASSGLGAQFARVLAQAGASVVLAARRVDRLQALQGELRQAGAKAHVVALDVADVSSVDAAVGSAEALAGPIDILINNAGTSSTQRLLDVRPEDFDHVLNTNLRGAFFVAQAAARRMLSRPVPNGRIVNVASLSALKVLPQIGIYGASKAALVQLTQYMALEWGRAGLNVNALCPGYIETEMNQAHWASEPGQRLIERLPRRRLGQPQDLDTSLLMLCALESRMVNGMVLRVDDGWV